MTAQRDRDITPLFYSTQEVATILHVSPNHVRKLITQGDIKAERFGDSRSIRVPRSEVQRLTGDSAVGHEALSSDRARDAIVKEIRGHLTEAFRLLAQLEG